MSTQTETERLQRERTIQCGRRRLSIGEGEAVGLCAKEHSSVGRAVVAARLLGIQIMFVQILVESFRAIVTTLSIPVDRMVGV
jgi:hypothetical protein